MYIEKYPKKIIEAAEIIRITETYEKTAGEIRKLVEEGILLPVKASGLNGRSPVLYNKYEIVRLEKDYSEAFSKIKLLHAHFDHKYCLTHPEHYLATKEDIEALSNFLWNRSLELKEPMSFNERSFSIFGKEKLLKSIENQFSIYFRMQGLPSVIFIPILRPSPSLNRAYKIVLSRIGPFANN